jgi:sulfhydrogenase subunit alpha
VSHKRIIQVDELARVEGEGSLFLRIDGNEVSKAELRIFEPPRYFEALLVGRDFREAPDITARICGICPVAYLLTACQAMEQLCGAELDDGLETLRKLLYCGEWIESHVLHIAMLHAPDFLGYPDAMSMAREHRQLVEDALRLKKCGNSIVGLLGGREVHPINIRLGGFYRVPTRAELQALAKELEWSVTAAERLVQSVATFPFEEFERDYQFVSLGHPDEYPLHRGDLAVQGGRRFPVSAYDELFEERHDAHSTALRTYPGALSDSDWFHLGPLARYANGYELLTPRARAAADAVGLGRVCRNPFKSIIVRAVEVLFAFESALTIVENYQRPDAPCVEVEPRPGTGSGATEAPRGLLYHRYTIDEDGLIRDAKIVAPTSVNQRIIEQDLYHYAGSVLDQPDDVLQARCEQAIRNYDPCISCSTHFLDLTVERDGDNAGHRAG